MPPRPRRMLVLAAVAAGIAALALAGLALYLTSPGGITMVQRRFERVASSTLGMEVRVGGPLRVSFDHAMVLSMDSVSVRDPVHDLAGFVPHARLALEEFALLGGRVRLQRIDLVRPTLAIERYADGRTNIDGLKRAMASLGKLDGARITVDGGSVRLAEQGTGERYIADGIRLDVRRLRFADPSRPMRVMGFMLDAKMSCAQVRAPGVVFSEVDVAAKVANGVLELGPIQLLVLGGHATGALRADVSGPEPRYSLRCKLTGVRGEQLVSAQSPKALIHGPLDFTADLATSGATSAQCIRNAAGQVDIRGSQLQLIGDDLDRKLSRFESSQSFSIVDVGAAVLAGPFGIVATRGYDVLALFQGRGGASEIEHLSSDWRIDRGVAHARDVALSTHRHRLALQGDLDFVNQRFDDVSVAVVDPGGCALVRQDMRGSFARPVLEKPHLLVSLAGPVLHLVRRVRALLPARPCVPYYSGAVPPPSGK